MVLLLELAQVERALDREVELREMQRLDHIVVGTGLDGLERDLQRAVRGHQDDGNAGRALFDQADEIQAIHLGHLEIGENQVVIHRFAGLQILERKAWVRMAEQLIAAGLVVIDKQRLKIRIVFKEKDPSFGFLGGGGRGCCHKCRPI